MAPRWLKRPIGPQTILCTFGNSGNKAEVYITFPARQFPTDQLAAGAFAAVALFELAEPDRVTEMGKDGDFNAAVFSL